MNDDPTRVALGVLAEAHATLGVDFPPLPGVDASIKEGTPGQEPKIEVS